jgi:glycosyltransferase involved in cell wall biosynthesis
MVIIVDGRPFQNKLTGIGKYIITVLTDLEKKYVDVKFVIISNKKIGVSLPFKNYSVLYEHSVLRHLKPMVWYILFSHRILRNVKADLFFAGASFVPFFLKKVRVISIVHDLNHILVPETMSKLHYITYKLFFKKSLLSSDHIITNSNATKEKLFQYFKVNANEVIYPYINPTIFKKLPSHDIDETLIKYNINYPYILSVSTFEPRKNIDKIITVFLELKAEQKISDYKLILVGGSGWKSNRLQNMVNSNLDKIIQLGYVPDKDLVGLYNGAKVFMFPSKYEGFGMPAREAIYCGTKCITSDIPELIEATDQKAIYIDPNDINDLKDNVLKLLYDN